jgi:hypothetical protein
MIRDECSFYCNGKFHKFSKDSLGILSNKNPIRKLFVTIMTSKHFERFVIFLILLNSLFLGINDYTDFDNDKITNKILSTSEPIFTTLFTLEAIIKIVGMGFFIGSGSYLREAWNWLDFIVVITSLLNFIPSMKNVSVLRTFRLFRPLRSLTTLSNMRILIGTLLSSVY